MRVSVRAHPGASRERQEWREGTLHVWVTARAVEDQANRALVRALARSFGAPPSRVTLVTGHHGRDKLFELELDDDPPGRSGATSDTPGRS